MSTQWYDDTINEIVKLLSERKFKECKKITKEKFIKDDVLFKLIEFKSKPKNNHDAQFALAVCYDYGIGIKKNFDCAFDIYEKLAHKNYDKAQLILGKYYEDGICMDEDEKLAFEWYKKSADNGNDEAKYYLALCYEYGKNVEIDLTYAFELYELSAKAGIPEAQYAIGLCYEYGKGVIKDLVSALKWYKMSESQGIPLARYRLGLFYKHGLGGLEKNTKKAINLLNAVLRNTQCDCNCQNKVDVVNSLIEIYKIDCKKDVKHMYNLGVCYYTLKDYESAFYCYEEAAYAKYAPAQYALGYCYKHGIGVKADKVFIEWYKLANDQDNELAYSYFNTAV